MTFKLPERTHLVHKPVELRNLSKKLQASVDLDSDLYEWEVKYDGCHLIVVKVDGKAYGFSREGNEVQSCNHILREIERLNQDNYVFFGEAWDHRKQHSEISGDFRRFSPATNLLYMVFDGVPLSDFIAGSCPVQQATRRRFLADLLYCPDLRDYLVMTETREDNFVGKCREQGCPAPTDGYVAKLKTGLWVAGAGKGGEFIKVKNHVSVDLRCVGVEMGLGKFAGKVGSLLCEYRGQVISVGGGKLTDAEREAYWNNKALIVGHIVEVHALSDSAHGLLREPRYQRHRPDKTEPSE